ncbi:uncharacterized protein LOC134854574 isoform X2 [Symsagittifera roscoffensis]|uniref:uncharacterized protein LOC134854574 isoform X2 n=1 Tax=Symsagittifera roscoffensis TaxID=84072 RepID=UPI00307B9A15
MDWRNHPQYTPKRNAYVKGIVDSLGISEQEAARFEQQIWNSAPSLQEYPQMLRAKLDSLKQQRQQHIQKQQMYQQQQVVTSQQQQLIRVPISNNYVMSAQQQPSAQMPPQGNPMMIQQQQQQQQGNLMSQMQHRMQGGGGPVGLPHGGNVSSVPWGAGGVEGVGRMATASSGVPVSMSSLPGGIPQQGVGLPTSGQQQGAPAMMGMHGQAVKPAVGNVPSSQAVMMTSPNTGMNSSSAAAVGGLKMVANGPDLMVPISAAAAMSNVSSLSGYSNHYPTSQLQHQQHPSSQLTIGAQMTSNPNSMMSSTSPAVQMASPSGVGMHAYSPHLSTSAANSSFNNVMSNPSPVAPSSVENTMPVSTQHSGTGVNLQGQQTQQQSSASGHQISEHYAEKIRQQILKFTSSVNKSLSSIETTPLWTPGIQRVYECGKGGMSRLNQLSHAELELFSREIKSFHQKYSKNKPPNTSEKVIRAITDILPMPSLNYNLNKVFNEPKRIAKGSLITCPGKKPKVGIESYLLETDNDKSEVDSQREELKLQLQKEIAVNSENFDIKFAKDFNYSSDPIVLNCCLKNKRNSETVAVLQISVFSDYPDEAVEVKLLTSAEAKLDEKHKNHFVGEMGKSEELEIKKASDRFQSMLNSSQNCSFSHALNKFVIFNSKG